MIMNIEKHTKNYNKKKTETALLTCTIIASRKCFKNAKKKSTKAQCLISISQLYIAPTPGRLLPPISR